MSTHIHVAYSGSDLSTGDNSNPYTVNGLVGSNSEISTSATLTIYTEPGLKTTGTTALSLAGTNSTRWQLSWDNITWSAWGAGLSTAEAITTTGKTVHIRARALPTDTKGRDDTVDLKIDATITAT